MQQEVPVPVANAYQDPDMTTPATTHPTTHFHFIFSHEWTLIMEVDESGPWFGLTPEHGKVQ